jgi:hypothetical protein
MTVNFRGWRGLWEFLSSLGNLFGCYYTQYVPAFNPFDHARFEVLEATTLYCTWSDNRQFQDKFCGLLNIFIRRAKMIRIIGYTDNQRPDKWSSTVIIIIIIYDVFSYLQGC